MESQKFELPESTYDILEKILSAYALNPDKELEIKEIMSFSGLSRNAVSANHKFLVSAGVLVGVYKKRLTDNGKTLALAISNKIKSEVASAWRQIINDCPQTQAVLKQIKANGSIAQEELPGRVLHALQMPGNTRGTEKSKYLIDIFLQADLIREKGGHYVYTGTKQSTNEEHVSPDPSVHFNVQIHIDPNAKPEQIDQIFASMAKHLYGRG
ncbi:MAG: hypothetical protein ACOX3G_12750 [Armatimonadota bacterium]